MQRKRIKYQSEANRFVFRPICYLFSSESKTKKKLIILFAVHYHFVHTPMDSRLFMIFRQYKKKKNQMRISEEEEEAGKSIYELPQAVSIDKRHMWNCRNNRTLSQCTTTVESGKTYIRIRPTCEWESHFQFSKLFRRVDWDD